MSSQNFKRKYPDSKKPWKPRESSFGGGKGDTRGGTALPEEPAQVFEESAEAKIFEIKTNRKNFTATGFLSNFRAQTTTDEDNQEITAFLAIFYTQGGDWVSCYLPFHPYFLVRCAPGRETDVASFLEKRYEGKFTNIATEDKVDLQTMNHLSGIHTRFLKCSFQKEADMNIVRSDVNKRLFARKFSASSTRFERGQAMENVFDLIIDIHEHDIPYTARVCIDNKLRVSFWYKIVVEKGFLRSFEVQPQMLEKPEFSILAFDIETSKLPYKFPDARIDSVLLISYVIDRSTYLIVNRELVSADIEPFEYEPRQDFAQSVTVYNEPDEKTAIKRFFEHIRIAKPLVITTFNGDMFDIPFLHTRCGLLGIDMETESGLRQIRSGGGDIFTGKHIFCHLDCYYWVKRDAFLPQGSHGLKAVTKAKLGYVPIECDPEEIMDMARHSPQKLAEYSVSDAVATFFLYTKHIHDFVFALCTIVPMTPDDVLRRGSGTLCENLLMAQAFENRIVFPNKKVDDRDKYYNGYLIESETYVGGFVECLNNGAYREDIPQDFKVDPRKYTDLVDSVEQVIEFFLKREQTDKIGLEDIENLREVEDQITTALLTLRNEAETSPQKVLRKGPLIYHVDVASMYPNIILTNRLQPTAIVNDQICSNCLYNERKNMCKRPLTWEWRVTHYPVKKLEYEKLLENADTGDRDGLKASLKLYCQKNYKSVHKTVVEPRENIVCMRENSFYVDTIRAFRDRRYDYKNKARVFGIKEKQMLHKNNFEKANEAATLSVLFDSLQLAHKIILNSFYGYVMKKGARWYSMKMAAMVTNTGKWIIQEARTLFEKVGKPLELDTDGIWTMLPQGFPEKVELRTRTGKRLRFNYICSLINHLIFDKFKNPQYQELRPDGGYEMREEMQIFFEIDGPYKAMIIPASKEENKKLKKRYVVFNFEGKITEIKGFEIKRRGELGIVKMFQSEIFSKFLEGNSLKGLYSACAETAKKWVAILKSKGARLSDAELVELLGEMKVLSKSVDEYGVQKGIALTAAKRLAQINGEEILKGTGLNCQFVISNGPESAPLNERAVPVTIFMLQDKDKRRRLLKSWLKVGEEADLSLKANLDWDYYLDRLNSTIQKIIVIPAILQGLENPLPELGCPDWLKKRVNADTGKQNTLNFELKKTAQDQPQIPTAISKASLLADKTAQEKFETQIQKSQQQPEPESVSPQAMANLSHRLAQRKAFWLQERARKKAQILPGYSAQNKHDIAQFVQSAQEVQGKGSWHIVKISSADSSGVVRFWYVLSDMVAKTQSVEITRFFYINSFTDERLINGNLKPSRKELPHEKPGPFLYEFEVSESDFQADYWKFTYFITDPSKEGIYETNVPLAFRALTSVGTACKTDQRVAPKQVMALETLLPELAIEPPRFFRESVFSGNRFLIFVWSLSYKQRLFTFFFTPRFIRVVLLSKRNRADTVPANILCFLREYLRPLEDDPILGPLCRQIELTPECVISCKDEEAYTGMLGQFKNDFEANLKKCPTVVVLSSKAIAGGREVGINWGELPVLEFHSSEIDRSKIDDLVSEKTFVERAVADLQSLNSDLMRLDRLSQFSRVPLCNLGPTWDKSLVTCIDTMFGRELAKANAVSWYSADGRPDLGVKGFNHYELEDFLGQQQLICHFSEPSFCQTYVVEVNTHKFFNGALAVMEQFVHLDREVRTGAKERAFNMASMHTTYSTFNKSGLKIIKNLYRTWLEDLEKHGKDVAGDVLDRLVPWACSHESRFHDPVMETAILRIAKQLFRELLVRLEGLGMRVVFANPYKLFLDTQKTTLASALNSINFVLETVVKEPLFFHMYFSVEQVFKTLLFYDLGNFIGVLHDFEGRPPEEVEDADARLALVSEWNIHRFLPAPAHKHFFEVLTHYFDHYFQLLQKHRLGRVLDQGQTQRASASLLQEMEKYLFGEFSEAMYPLLTGLQEQQRACEYLKFELSHKKDSPFGSTFKKKSSRQTEVIDVDASYDNDDDEDEEEEEDEEDSFIEDDEEAIHEERDQIGGKRKPRPTPLPPATPSKKNRRREEEEEQSWELVTLVGGGKRSTNLAFEFMNLITELLMINCEDLRLVVEGLKVGFLKFLKSEETLESSRFQKTFIPCTLVNLSCGSQSCNILKNLSVFEEFSAEAKGWFCYCGQKYPSAYIEARLIEYVNTCYKLWVTAPDKCVKCKRLRSDFFSTYCTCHGTYRKDVDRMMTDFGEELASNLANYKALAVAAGLRLLEDLLADLSV